MAKTAKNKAPEKDYGHMEELPNLLEAVLDMNLDKVKACVDSDPQSVHQKDRAGNNALHLCISGGSPRVWQIIEFLVEETDIDLLHKNHEDVSPIDMALNLNDQKAAQYLYGPTTQRLREAHPDPTPEMK